MMKVTVVFSALWVVLSFIATGGVSSAAELKTHTNSIGMEFVLIPAGSFMMGSDPNIEEGYDNERPLHKVTIAEPFYLGKYEVTQGQWVTVMGSNPSKFEGRDNPVERVSWHDAQEFIRKLNAKEGHNRYRLPTEAEWEYAARAGTSSAYFFGDDKNALSGYAWYYGENPVQTTRPVGQKQPNAWGLYDVHGNVWEWAQDWYGERYYSESSETDPKGPASGEYRVIRGGSWDYTAGYCRSASRADYGPDDQSGGIGFRLALSQPTAARP